MSSVQCGQCGQMSQCSSEARGEASSPQLQLANGGVRWPYALEHVLSKALVKGVEKGAGARVLEVREAVRVDLLVRRHVDSP